MNRWHPRRLLGALTVALTMISGAASAWAQSAPPSTEASESARFGYGERGLFAESGDGNYRFRLSNRVQVLFEFIRLDGGELDDDETNVRFRARRVRTTMSGNVFSRAVRYKLQFAWEQGDVTLYDAEIDFVLHPDWLSIKVGQFKVPTSRNFITSSGDLELVDRPITHGAFFNDRDIGIVFHNGYGHPLEYSVGLYNGTGTRARFRGTARVDPVTLEGPVSGFFSNVAETFRPLFVARVGSSLGEGDMYSEGDLDGGGFGIGFGATGYVELDVDEDDETTAGGTVDFMSKVAGFSVTGAASLQHFETDSDDEDVYGGFVQTGYAFPGGELVTLEPAARYAVVVERDGDQIRHEAGGGLSAYFVGHRLKLQTDALALIDDDDDDGLPDDGPERVDVRLRAQLQLEF